MRRRRRRDHEFVESYASLYETAAIGVSDEAVYATGFGVTALDIDTIALPAAAAAIVTKLDATGKAVWAKSFAGAGGNPNVRPSGVSANAKAAYVAGAFDTATLVFGTDTLSRTLGGRFLPLVEGDLLAGTDVPVETMSSAFADLVSRISGEPSHDLLVSVHGVSGTPYEGLKRGTPAYDSGMGQVKAARDLSRAAGKTYVVRAVTNVHGESDHIARNAAYESNLETWQRDYEDDVRALTGQAEPVPMFVTQMSSWTMYGTEASEIPFAQLAAHVEAPGKVILVGPRYHLAYSEDGVHLTSAGYRHMGEDYAKAYRRVVLEGRPWEPLRPRRITRVGAVITVAFQVPSPPLVLDREHVSDPGSYGFSVADDTASPPSITRVTLTGPDTITITLASPPGEHARVRYAFSAPAGASGGPRSGARGNLRDSDATPSRSGESLYDWCVHFDEPVEVPTQLRQ